ncbi:MAG: hypothetical protein A2033_18655 [Bacteroidetes bacterium GWA2_31_9]|nr:MAG: hypothetical protein A2033_18655 [Bacteroidetes bacterium GWA2_31_9]
MNENLLNQIGDKLRELRIKSGYTSYESFAFDNDLPRVQYWRLEKGKTNPTVKTLEKLLKIHNISFRDFFEGIG